MWMAGESRVSQSPPVKPALGLPETHTLQRPLSVAPGGTGGMERKTAEGLETLASELSPFFSEQEMDYIWACHIWDCPL